MSVQNVELEILIDTEGNVTYQVKGVKGKKCVDETKFLDEALGGEVVERKFKSEYYQETTQVSRRVYQKR